MVTNRVEGSRYTATLHGCAGSCFVELASGWVSAVGYWRNGLFAAVDSKPVTVDGQTEYVKQVVFDTNEHREEFLAKLLHGYRAWTQNRAAAANTA